jgi:transcriptional regulator with XRE-family HTH domain
MMTQEEYMDVLAMRRRGMSFKEIGDELGYHPATISNWVRNGGPPPARTVDAADRVIDVVWADRLTALLVGNPDLLAKSLFEIIAAEGFVGSYPSVVRWAREQRPANCAPPSSRGTTRPVSGCPQSEICPSSSASTATRFAPPCTSSSCWDSSSGARVRALMCCPTKRRRRSTSSRS